jgi:hypothetical protein
MVGLQAPGGRGALPTGRRASVRLAFREVALGRVAGVVRVPGPIGAGRPSLRQRALLAPSLVGVAPCSVD